MLLLHRPLMRRLLRLLLTALPRRRRPMRLPLRRSSKQ
jgi:hypothetical protein